MKTILRHKVLVGLLLLPISFVSFLLVEHVRGRISLSSYIRALSARGEKMTARDFQLPLPPGENGAPEVLAAAKDLTAGAVLPNSYPPRMMLTAAGNAVVGFRENQWVEGKVTNHWEQLAADLEANKDTLERIRTAMAKPVLSCGLDPTLGARALFPHLPVPKTLTYWFGSKIALGLHQRKMRDTLKDLVTETDLPRMLASDGIVISELVRVAIAGVARSDTWEALQADGWTDEDFAQLQQAWERQQFVSPMARALEGERAFGQSTYQLMSQSNEETVGVIYGLEDYLPGAERAQWEQTLSDLPGGEAVADFLKKQVYSRLWRFAWLDQDELHYLQYVQQLVELARNASQQKSLQRLEPLQEALVLKFQNHGFYDRLRYFSVMSVNSLSRTVPRAMRAETERSLVLTAIALKRYALRHGGLPESLSVLVPEFLPVVPVDYMDGQLIRYRREADGRFVLYSVGEDGKDDQGDTSLRPDKTNPRVLWERKDVVWPHAASTDEVEAYHNEAGKH